MMNDVGLMDLLVGLRIAFLFYRQIILLEDQNVAVQCRPAYKICSRKTPWLQRAVSPFRLCLPPPTASSAVGNVVQMIPYSHSIGAVEPD